MARLEAELVEQTQRLMDAVLHRHVRRKATASEVEISDAEIALLVAHYWSEDDSSSTVDDKQHLLEFSESEYSEIFADLEGITASVPDAVRTSAENAGQKVLTQLEDQWPLFSAAREQERAEFRDRLLDRWGAGIDRMHMLLLFAHETRDQFLRRRKRSKKARVEADVLVRLHARACQIGDEIVSLLEDGFANGALGRWRTLYETYVVASVLSTFGESIAIKYVDHDVVEARAGAIERRDRAIAQGLKPRVVGLRTLEKSFQKMLDQYGKAFASPYGWAADALGKKRPTFADLEDVANKARMREVYRMASYSVHAGPSSLLVRPEAPPDTNAIIAGRTNFGLNEAAINAAYSLGQITLLVMPRGSGIKNLGRLKVLQLILSKLEAEFSKADRKLRRDYRKHLKGG